MAAPNHDGDDVIPDLRGAYNSSYTAERYSEYSRRLAERAGVPIPFRLAERSLMVGVLNELLRKIALGFISSTSWANFRSVRFHREK